MVLQFYFLWIFDLEVFMIEVDLKLLTDLWQVHLPELHFKEPDWKCLHFA